jgi:hypothetical protein
MSSINHRFERNDHRTIFERVFGNRANHLAHYANSFHNTMVSHYGAEVTALPTHEPIVDVPPAAPVEATPAVPDNVVSLGSNVIHNSEADAIRQDINAIPTETINVEELAAAA